VPTLVATRAFINEERHADDPRLSWLPLTLRDTWQRADQRWRESPLPRDEQAARTMAQLSERLLSSLSASAVPIMLGTHTATILPFIFPGASVHDELVAMTHAGLSPLQALQAATVTPARFLGHGAQSGVAAPGGWADLVVLDGNPTVDIEHVRSIFAVVANGRFYDRATLNALKGHLSGQSAPSYVATQSR
jgi:adenine deaminase